MPDFKFDVTVAEWARITAAYTKARLYVIDGKNLLLEGPQPDRAYVLGQIALKVNEPLKTTRDHTGAFLIGGFRIVTCDLASSWMIAHDDDIMILDVLTENFLSVFVEEDDDEDEDDEQEHTVRFLRADHLDPTTFFVPAGTGDEDEIVTVALAALKAAGKVPVCGTNLLVVDGRDIPYPAEDWSFSCADRVQKVAVPVNWSRDDVYRIAEAAVYAKPGNHVAGWRIDGSVDGFSRTVPGGQV